MEQPPNENREKIRCDKQFIIEKLGFIVESEKEDDSDDYLTFFTSDEPLEASGKERAESLSLVSPERIASYFEGAPLRISAKVTRPHGDVTFFTTAGVQLIDMALSEKADPTTVRFTVAQPVIRSQFMDKVEDGVSTAFVNFSVELTNSQPEEFIDAFKKFITLLRDGLNVKEQDLRFFISEKTSRWGHKQFSSIRIKTFLKKMEVGSAVYIPTYPISENKITSVTDIGFGVERALWAAGKSASYFQEFEQVYRENPTFRRDYVTAVLDPIRSMVLIAADGVQGSNHDHGYRFRQLSKRFVRRCRGFNLEISDLIKTSLNYWQQWGYVPTVSQQEIVHTVQTENERNANALLLEILKNKEGLNVSIDINQPTSSFLRQLGFSVPKETILKIKQEIAEIT